MNSEDSSEKAIIKVLPMYSLVSFTSSQYDQMNRIDEWIIFDLQNPTNHFLFDRKKNKEIDHWFWTC